MPYQNIPRASTLRAVEELAAVHFPSSAVENKDVSDRYIMVTEFCKKDINCRSSST